jgi:hypothetical protein
MWTTLGLIRTTAGPIPSPPCRSTSSASTRTTAPASSVWADLRDIEAYTSTQLSGVTPGGERIISRERLDELYTPVILASWTTGLGGVARRVPRRWRGRRAFLESENAPGDEVSGAKRDMLAQMPAAVPRIGAGTPTACGARDRIAPFENEDDPTHQLDCDARYSISHDTRVIAVIPVSRAVGIGVGLIGSSVPCREP